MSMCRVFSCVVGRVFAMTGAFSWQNSISLCPASFCTPRPNLPVTPGVSWLLTFAFKSPIMERTSFNGDLLQKFPCTHCCQPCSRPPPTHISARVSWTLTGKSGSVSCEVTAPFSWVLVCTRFVCTLQESVSPVLCKFCGGVNDHLLQEGLCHTQVYCTQSPCPCSSPLLTCTSAGDTQTQFCLSLCGVWVLVCTRFVSDLWKT